MLPSPVAEQLHITDVDNWKCVARHLRITDQEVSDQMRQGLVLADPVMALMAIYKNRAGTYDEFVEALYEASAHLGSEAPEPEEMRSVSQQNSFTSISSDNTQIFTLGDEDEDIHERSTVHLTGKFCST